MNAHSGSETSGRVLAIGDVHGCSRALDLVLEQVQPTELDLLIFLGDYIDRGPDSKGVIDRIRELALTHQVVALLGNHEIMMLEANRDLTWARDWLRVGGLETLESYRAQTTRDIPEAHWEFLKKFCQTYYETDTHIFVHAGADSELDMQDQTEDWLFWNKFKQGSAHKSGKILICGHTAQKTGVPLEKHHAICIDTWAYGDGWLTCLDVKTGHYWQARQSGEIRDGWL